MLDLTQETYEWTESAPMTEGRYNFDMVVANGKIYAVGGEGAFSAHDNIEVGQDLIRSIYNIFIYLT
jgi:hypothetical protein